MDYLVRQENTQKAFLSEGGLDVIDILKTYYGYIYDSIQREGFILKYGRCNLFKELVFEGKVVGFCSYDYSRQFITSALNNIYVLPEFRGNGLFLKELERTMAENSKPSIMEPTRLVVEMLVRYGFARKVTDTIVASAIEFVVPQEHVLSNKDHADEELSTHFYDLGVCRCIHILDLSQSHLAYSSPLNQDIMAYDCFCEIDDDYISETVNTFLHNNSEFSRVLMNLEDALPLKSYTLEEVIGDDGEFSFYIESLIGDAHVTRQKALEITEQFKSEYENGVISDESLLIRLAYLFNTSTEPSIKSHAEVCPFCRMPIDSHDKYCHFCGIILESV
jgi:hypothetical protein